MRRRANPGRFRKTGAANAPDLMARSGVLRGVRDCVKRRQFASALSQINTQLAANPAPAFKTQLLCFAADALFAQGKFSEAAGAYAQVGQQAQTQPLNWLRPAMGEVLSLLKDTQVAAAQTRALAVVQQGVTVWQQYQAQFAQANAAIAAGGQAVIPAKPPTPAAVTNRLAKQFFSEGEVAIAKALFQQALQLSPNSCHARLGLAEIALRESDGATAAQLARQAITLGLYRAKTLPAWNLLLAAGRRLGTDTLDTPLLNGLAQATPKVRARAVLALAAGLRGQGDARWQTIASNWLTQSGANQPKIAAELRKLKVAHSRLNATPLADQLQAAQAVLQTPNLSPSEWLAATKETVRLQFQLSQAPQLDALITQGTTRYGAGKQARFTHGLALACKKAGQNAFAVQLLQRNVTNATGEAQVRAQYALAQTQAAQGNHADAAQNYWTISQNSALGQRKRLYALMQWTREISATSQPELIGQARPQIEAALPQISDYELVLDLSRQVLISKIERSFAMQVFERGQQLALAALSAAGHPATAATILFKFARRANDLCQYDAIISTWTGLNEAKRNWLWSAREDFWNYLELIFRAYRDSNQGQAGEQFITTYLNDSATPPHGYAILGVSYAAMKRNQSNFAAMFATYEKMIQVAPTHEWTCAAYYWLALRAWKRGLSAVASAFGDKILLVIENCTRGHRQIMRASAWCLKVGLDVSQVPPEAGVSTGEFQVQRSLIQRDLAHLNLSV